MAASARFKDAAQQLQDGLSSVDLETTQLLGSGWKGGAATAFGTAWDGWHNGAGQVVRGLQSMGDMLSLAGKEYAKGDSDNARALQSTMGGGGGAAAGGSSSGSSGSSSGAGSGAAQSGSSPGGAGGAGGADQLGGLAQQMVGALGQVGQVAGGIAQAAGQAAQLATGIVQAATQGQQGGADSAGKDAADDSKDDKDKAGRDKAEKEKDETERDSETDGTAGPSVEQRGLKAPVVDGPVDAPVDSPVTPLPARPQTRPADGREV